MARVEVGRFDELVEAVPTTVTAGGREMILVRWREDVFALRNICPHQSASFAAGRAQRCLTGVTMGDDRDGASAQEPPLRAFDFTADETMPVILCPWHKWEFRLTDGHCSTDSRFRVRSYTTHVEDGTVFVDVG
jgi:nitrite reductase/ring-hydroxylating ferredoxin subunit